MDIPNPFKGDLGERLTKKIGPLPLWVWAVIIVGVGYAGYRIYSARFAGTAAEGTGDPITADATDDTLSGYSSGFAESPSNSGGLSTGSGGSQYTPTATDLLDSSGIGMASFPYTQDNPLPVRIESINPNLNTGTQYEPTGVAQGGGDSGSGAAAQQTAANNQRAGLQAAYDNALANERAAQAELSAAKAAEQEAQAALSAAKQSNAKASTIANLQDAKNAAAARSGVAAANKASAAAASGVARANLG